MTYDSAVWEGTRPADDAEAGRILDELHDRYLESADLDLLPTDRVRSYSRADEVSA